MRFPVALMIFVTGVYRVGFGASSSSNDPVDDAGKKPLPISQIQLCSEEPETSTRKIWCCIGNCFNEKYSDYWLNCYFVNGYVEQCFESMPYSKDLPKDKPLVLDDGKEWEFRNPLDKKNISLKRNEVVLIVSKRTIGKDDHKYLGYKILPLTAPPSDSSLKIIFSYRKGVLGTKIQYTTRRNS